MSNKAIVFYNEDHITEAQELSLRSQYAVEDIVFAPIRNVDDIRKSTVLDKTPVPFAIYNYLTDPRLVIEVCNDVLQFKKTTGFEPQYYTWIETQQTTPEKETNMSVPKSRIVFITSSDLLAFTNLQETELSPFINFSVDLVNTTDAVQLKQVFNGNIFRGVSLPTVVLIDDRHPLATEIKHLVEGHNVYNNIKVGIIDVCEDDIHTLMERFVSGDVKDMKPITRVMNPESFMVSGVVLSDDVMFGFEFDTNAECYIYTSSEKNLLSWFNVFIMNTTNSKREFPMLKAVIYAFSDERNQPMLGGDRDHHFVVQHIVAALELFGKTQGIKIFKPSEMEEFKQYIALTEEEKEQRKLLAAQVQRPEALHVDVSHSAMPDSVKVVMQRLESKLEEERPDPYLSYGEAIEMCKKGIDVACVNWKADEFLTVNTGMTMHADKFWSNGNKRAAMVRLDQSLSVFPYTLRTTSYGTVPHMVDFNDQFSEWVVASDRIKVKRATINSDEGLPKLTLHYALDTFSTPDFELAPFWIVYDVLAKFPSRVTVISDNPKSDLPHIVGSMKEAHDNRRQIIEESYNIGEDGIDDNTYSFRGVDFLCNIGLNETIKRIESGELKDVILDDDSFKTDFRLDKVKEALQKANANWVTVSVKEQLFGITE